MQLLEDMLGRIHEEERLLKHLLLSWMESKYRKLNSENAFTFME